MTPLDTPHWLTNTMFCLPQITNAHGLERVLGKLAEIIFERHRQTSMIPDHFLDSHNNPNSTCKDADHILHEVWKYVGGVEITNEGTFIDVHCRSTSDASDPGLSETMENFLFAVSDSHLVIQYAEMQFELGVPDHSQYAVFWDERSVSRACITGGLDCLLQCVDFEPIASCSEDIDFIIDDFGSVLLRLQDGSWSNLSIY